MQRSYLQHWHSWVSRILLSTALPALAATPAHAAADKSLAACMAEATTITATDETANGGVDAAAEAADIGLPVMDVGIVLSLNQINANLADLLGPLTAIANSTCDTNDTLSTSGSAADFIGWTDVDDTEPLPTVIPAQINGTAGLAFALARAANTEDTAAVRTMEMDRKDGYDAALIDNQLRGLANMEGIGLSGIASEKLAIKAATENLEKLKRARQYEGPVSNAGRAAELSFRNADAVERHRGAARGQRRPARAISCRPAPDDP